MGWEQGGGALDGGVDGAGIVHDKYRGSDVVAAGQVECKLKAVQFSHLLSLFQWEFADAGWQGLGANHPLVAHWEYTTNHTILCRGIDKHMGSGGAVGVKLGAGEVPRDHGVCHGAGKGCADAVVGADVLFVIGYKLHV